MGSLMRNAICRLTSEITVLGNRQAVSIGPGSHVDLDQIVGEGCTLADALGPELLASFADVATSPTGLEVVGVDAPGRRPSRRPTLSTESAS
jgi:hypothetical protein